MGVRAGLLRETITILKLVSTKDSFGANSTEWTDKFTTRAQVTINSGNRENQNNEIVYTRNVTFSIRFYHAVTESDRVLYDGKKYRIISIDKERSKQSIHIIGEVINE